MFSETGARGWLSKASPFCIVRNQTKPNPLEPRHILCCYICTMETQDLTIPDLRDKVVAACKAVFDPEIPVDIWELGLIYDIKIYPVNNVYVLMTLTSPSCPSAGTLPGEVEQQIRNIEGINDVQLELTFDPTYNQEMMSEVAKLELGYM